jgi:hypothetical protein
VKDLFNDPTGTETWLANIVSGNLGISNSSGFIQTDPKLVLNSAGFYDLASNSIAIDNTKDIGIMIPRFEGLDADYDIVLDVIKNMRPADVLLKDIGAQEYQSGAVVKPHATLANTGPKYLQENVLGVQQIVYKNAVIYPNPAKNNFIIDSASGEEISEVLIYNVSGALVYKSNNHSSKVTINEKFAKGVYFVKISTNDSNFVTQKLIVE